MTGDHKYSLRHSEKLWETIQMQFKFKFRKEIDYECHLSFQNAQNLNKISKMEKKIEKIILLCWIIAFDTVPADSKYNKENTCDRLSMF